jgi:DNA processing protein
LSQPDVAYVTLALVPGIGRARLEMLLATFESAEAALEARQADLEEVPGMTRAAATAIRDASRRTGEKVLERARGLGATALVPTADEFPPMLRDIPDAPTLLFAKGRLELLAKESVGIVGSRSHTRYGAGACRLFAGESARAGLVVVSGMARGLDRVAHEAALDQNGGTVGVLGNGLGVVYPAANRALYDRVAAEGCLLSEYPPGEKPHAGSFPRRNRLISGLSRVTIVVEAREKSGALITADCALTQGREVLAVPGPITSPLSLGCNRLIQLGAKPALGLRDVLEEYGRTVGDAPASTVPTDLTDAERGVLDILSTGVEHVDDVATRSGRPVAEALAILTSLEIRGLVMQEPGKVFRLAYDAYGAAPPPPAPPAASTPP